MNLEMSVLGDKMPQRFLRKARLWSLPADYDRLFVIIPELKRDAWAGSSVVTTEIRNGTQSA